MGPTLAILLRMNNALMKSRALAILALSFITSTVACGQGSAGSPAKAPPPSKASAPAVSQVVSGMRGDLKACYAQGLELDPTLTGSFVAELTIGPAGGVDAVDARDIEGLNRPVIACMTKRMHNARFPAPGEKGATVVVPLRFRA